MEREDFAYLLFRIEELLVEIDHWRRQVSDCKKCRGWAEEAYGNLCTTCLQALSEEFETLEKVADKAEMGGALRALKHALADDKTGELTLIFKVATRRLIDRG